SDYSYLNVVENNTVIFNYILSPPVFSDSCAPEICFDCLYDLELSISDDCGILFDTTLKNYTPSEYNIDCIAADSFDLKKEIILPIVGREYHFTKILKVSQDALDYYTEQFLEKDTCILSRDEFINEAVSRVDLSGCGMTCAQCTEKVGTIDE